MVSEEDKNQPKAWLCKHCNERVDPTMALCWSCGHDRDGEFDADSDSGFGSILDETGPPLTEEQLYDRSASRGGILSIVSATILLIVGIMLGNNFGISICCPISIISLGLFAHGLIGMTHRPSSIDRS